MADITMCTDNACPLKDKCWRYKAPKNEYSQAYFVESPFDYDKLTCNYFWGLFKK